MFLNTKDIKSKIPSVKNGINFISLLWGQHNDFMTSSKKKKIEKILLHKTIYILFINYNINKIINISIKN